MTDTTTVGALKRTMHGVGALMITLSCLSPTIGVFVVGSDVIRQAGTGTFLCFLAAGLLGVAMACVYAELASAFPETGAEYTLTGRTLGPTMGFAALGMVLTGFTIALALSALGVADYLQVILPGAQQVPTALVLIVLVTGVGVLNIRLNALITGAFLALEVISLFVLAALGFSHAHRDIAGVLLHPMMAAPHAGMVPTSIAVMGSAAAGAIYAFNGYGAVVSLGEELHDAPKRIAPVVFWALGLATVLLLAPVLAVIVGAPDLRALTTAASPIPTFISQAGGPVLSKVMSLAVAIAIFNAMIAVVLVAGRLLFSTGRDQVWTRSLNRAFTRIHPHYHSPWIATLVMGAIALLWSFVPLKILLIVIGSGTVALYAGLCLGVIAGRRTGSTSHAGWRMPWFPLAPVIALVALVGVVWTSLMDPVSGQPGLLATAAVIAVSIGLYHFVLRPRGTWASRGPVEPEAEAAP